MRAVALSVWIFINLAFLGMGGYMYLILSTYWCRHEGQERTQPLVHKKIKFIRENQVVFYEPEIVVGTKELGFEIRNSAKKSNVILTKLGRIRRSSTVKDCRKGTNCTDHHQPRNKKLENFKNKLFIQLRTVLHEESNVFKTDNPYFVNYTGPRDRYQSLTADQIKCRLKKAGLRLLTAEDPFISGLKLTDDIEEKFLGGKHYKTCAIVSSAGSLLQSKLGRFIDEHEVVVRFNHAPTETYEEDIGAKTTVRLVNSQVVSKKEFCFTTNPLYKNVTLVVWDPSNYTASLQQWYEKPDFNFFELWATQKKLNMKKDSFLLDPRSIWRVWDFIQSLTSLRIRKNPPSSGFLGLALLMPYCDTIDFFEYVPSFRLTKKCHYFEDFEDDSCTFGVWHPLSAEKILSLAMNEANDTTVFNLGYIRVKGYADLKC
ncbi:hypothetical protein RUM44_010880 [Polyplax serrata]|uniref:beta-galactoside alpha-(2,6)-sialyltransferase n=1 Tax=Polyplax serrata TaxID=468196 RepID=A0ABR1ANH4_POLSC